MGQSGAILIGRPTKAALRGWRAPGLFQCSGSALGQPGLQLGHAAANWLSLVHRSFARSACARRCDSSGSFSRVRSGVACSWLGAPTAQSGQWEPGPGADFFNAVKKELGGLPFIAEDLGLITTDVRALRDQFRCRDPCPAICLRWQFGNPYLPHELRLKRGCMYRDA